MGKNPSQIEILQPVFTQSDISVTKPNNSIHSSRTASTFVLFLHSQSIYTYQTFIFALKYTYQIITHWESNSRLETIRRLVCSGVLHNFMLKCVLQYFDTFCLKFPKNFNLFHFSHTISYTSLRYNITNLPLTCHTRVSGLELYVKCINLSISGKWFVTHNQILHRSCNIGTAVHLSKFQKCFGKLL